MKDGREEAEELSLKECNKYHQQSKPVLWIKGGKRVTVTTVEAKKKKKRDEHTMMEKNKRTGRQGLVHGTSTCIYG